MMPASGCWLATPSRACPALAELVWASVATPSVGRLSKDGARDPREAVAEDAAADGRQEYFGGVGPFRVVERV